LVVGFAPFSLWFWVPLPLTVLYSLTRDAGWRRAGWLGGCFGAGQFGAGIFWVAESFQFSEIALPYAIAATAALVAFLALYPAVMAALVTQLRGGVTGGRLEARVSLAWMWAAGWVLLEWVRGTAFGGFTWLEVGAAQTDGPLALWVPVVGVYGVGFLVCALAALLGEAVRSRRRRALLALLLAGSAVGAGTLALREPEWTRPLGGELSVALVQGNIPQDEKWRPGNRTRVLDAYLEESRKVWGDDLVVWPETAVPGFLSEMGGYLLKVAGEAGARGSELLLGIPATAARTGLPVNAVLKLGGSDSGALYIKRHLVPFGEFIPLSDWVGPMLRAIGIPAFRLSNFEAGPARQTLMKVRGVPLGVSICYEVAFSGEVRRALPAAALLVNVSNDAWFGDTIGPHQHLQMARMRALESGRWLVRATNTGITAVIGPDGRVRASAPQFETTVLESRVQPRVGATPFVAFGDAPWLTLIAVVGLGAAGVCRWRRRP